jgi:ribonuclease HII
MTALLVSGVDEAGRGCWAGDVFAAAVVLDPARPIEGLADSKVLPARRRTRLSETVMQQSLAWAIGRASVEEIDRLNILQASMLAMRRAVLALSIRPQRLEVDGLHVPDCGIPGVAIVDGDARIPAISAASILAKCARDAELIALASRFPEYGFDQHKGYGTRAHARALAAHGPCEIHRQSFAPVRRSMAQPGLQLGIDETAEPKHGRGIWRNNA